MACSIDAAILYGLPIIQLPLAAAVVVAITLTAAAYHVPLSPAQSCWARRWRSWPRAQRRSRRDDAIVSAPCFAASALLAAAGHWTTLGASVVLFAVGDLRRWRASLPACTRRS